MRQNTTRCKIFWSIAILACIMLLPALASNNSPKHAKARYYYLEGSIHDASSEGGAASLELYKKAFQCDTAYLDAGYRTALELFKCGAPAGNIINNDSDIRFELMRRYIDARPADFNAAMLYSQICIEEDPHEAVRVLERTSRIFPKKTETLRFLANAYLSSGDAENAIAALNRYETIEGPSVNVSFYKVSIMIAKGDTLSALAETDNLYKHNPRNASYNLMKGQVLKAFGYRDSCFYYLKRAEELEPQNGATKTALAGYYKEMGDSAMYDAKTYEALLAEDFNREEKLNTLTDYLQKLIEDKSDTARGDYLFETIKEQYPHDPQILDISARYNFSKGNYEKAADDISYAIDQSPTVETYYQQLMAYLLQFADLDRIRKAYDRSIEHIGFNEIVARAMAGAYSLHEQPDSAIVLLGRIINKQYPTLPVNAPARDTLLRNHMSYEELQELASHYDAIGEINQMHHRFEPACIAYENSLFFMPYDPIVQNNYAYLLANEGGDLDVALNLIEKAMNQVPNNPTYLDTYAWVLYKRGDVTEARTYAESAIELALNIDEINEEYYDHMGDILFTLGDITGAIENWQKAIDINPDNPDIKEIRNKIKNRRINK